MSYYAPGPHVLKPPHAIDVCPTQAPAGQEISRGHLVSCHRAHELQLAGVD